MRNYWLRKQASGEILLTSPNGGSRRRDVAVGDDIEAASGPIGAHRLVRSDKSFSVPRLMLRENV
jgi:hypothetical protein